MATATKAEKTRKPKREAATAQPSIPMGNRAAELLRKGEAEEAKEIRELWGEYLRLLAKAEGPATDQDADVLVGLMRALGITAEQLAADRRTVANAQRLTKIHETCEDLNVRALQANRDYMALTKRQDKERHEAYVAKQSLHTCSIQASRAAPDLFQLARQRPELLDRTIDPPRLLVAAEPATRPPATKKAG